MVGDEMQRQSDDDVTVRRHNVGGYGVRRERSMGATDC